MLESFVNFLEWSFRIIYLMMLYTSIRAYKTLGKGCFDCKRDAIVFGIIFLIGLFFPKIIGGILIALLILGFFKNKKDKKKEGTKVNE